MDGLVVCAKSCGNMLNDAGIGCICHIAADITRQAQQPAASVSLSTESTGESSLRA